MKTDWYRLGIFIIRSGTIIGVILLGCLFIFGKTEPRMVEDAVKTVLKSGHEVNGLDVEVEAILKKRRQWKHIESGRYVFLIHGILLGGQELQEDCREVVERFREERSSKDPKDLFYLQHIGYCQFELLHERLD